MDIENPMVLDILWKKRIPRLIGECAGCYGDIYDDEQAFEMQTEFGTALIHNDSTCCHQFVIENATKKITYKKKKLYVNGHNGKVIHLF
jgi:hypothetical protein